MSSIASALGFIALVAGTLIAPMAARVPAAHALTADVAEGPFGHALRMVLGPMAQTP